MVEIASYLFICYKDRQVNQFSGGKALASHEISAANIVSYINPIVTSKMLALGHGVRSSSYISLVQ